MNLPIPSPNCPPNHLHQLYSVDSFAGLLDFGNNFAGIPAGPQCCRSGCSPGCTGQAAQAADSIGLHYLHTQAVDTPVHIVGCTEAAAEGAFAPTSVVAAHSLACLPDSFHIHSVGHQIAERTKHMIQKLIHSEVYVCYVALHLTTVFIP